MNVLLFSIHDAKADTFNTIFTFTTRGQALRAFKDLANDPNSSVGRHPGDYRLVVVGVLDDQTGRVTGLDSPESLGFASDYRDLAPGDVPVGVHGAAAEKVRKLHG